MGDRYDLDINIDQVFTIKIFDNTTNSVLANFRDEEIARLFQRFLNRRDEKIKKNVEFIENQRTCEHEWGIETTLDTFPAYHSRVCVKCLKHDQWTDGQW